MKHTIVLVVDHPIFRQGLLHLLAKEKDLDVVGEAGDGEAAVDQVRQRKPDLVVMDINMPNLDGIEATRQILAEAPETRVVALSVHSSKQFVRDMIQAGAAGYILKESIPEEMVAGIRAVLSGDVYLSKSISNLMFSDYKKLIPKPSPELERSSGLLLYTKLHRPRISADVIPRVRLIEMLEGGVRNPMALIAAAAGYGKSTLASQWLDVARLPGTWVSLDEGDNDLRVFLEYVLAAIENLFADCSFQLKTKLGAAELPAPEVTARHLLNDLECVPERFVLVLDDYHNIRQSVIHDLVSELLIHPSPNLHLVLVTRRDPMLPLAKLRAQGKLTEITTEHLRFTVSETQSLLERSLHIAVSDDTVRILKGRIEGWATELYLAALSVRGEQNRPRTP
jgi:LuxR family maltose regulon positive regulatory protein